MFLAELTQSTASNVYLMNVLCDYKHLSPLRVSFTSLIFRVRDESILVHWIEAGTKRNACALMVYYLPVVATERSTDVMTRPDLQHFFFVGIAVRQRLPRCGSSTTNTLITVLHLVTCSLSVSRHERIVQTSVRAEQTINQITAVVMAMFSDYVNFMSRCIRRPTAVRSGPW